MITRLLTELDAILDTRLGLIDSLDPEASVRLIANPQYYLREIDDMETLCGFSNERYKEAWANRTVDVLKHSLNTPTIDLVHYGLAEIERRSIDDPTVDGAALDVNIYPYKLTEQETHAFALSIAHCAGVKAQIRMINEPPKMFTVAHCRERYAGMILYNHVAWFQTHLSELMQHGMPTITMVIPKLWPNRVLTQKELTVDGLGVVDPWHQATLPMLQYVGLEYIDIKHYCIAHPSVPDLPA